MMNCCSHHIRLLVVACLCYNVCSQNEVCHFSGLTADCRYHVDLVCLSHVVTVIDPCADPVDVTVTITCNNPAVDFRHTFKSSDSIVSVPGYKYQVILRVRLRMKDEHLMNVEADFMVGGVDTTDFINSDINLKGQVDLCPNLNTASKIAIGIMAALVGLVFILIGVLVYERSRQ